MDVRKQCEDIGRLLGQVLGEYLLEQLKVRSRCLDSSAAAEELDMNVAYLREKARNGGFGDHAWQEGDNWFFDVVGYRESKRGEGNG